MAIPIVSDIIKGIGIDDLISEIVVDKDKRDEINFKLKELADKADERIHEQTMAQIEVNKAEAQHRHVFVAGWRPFIGWTGGLGLAYAAIVEPLLRFGAKMLGYAGEFPVLDNSVLVTVLTGMLGIAGMRTVEKYHGVADHTIGKVGDE